MMMLMLMMRRVVCVYLEYFQDENGHLGNGYTYTLRLSLID